MFQVFQCCSSSPAFKCNVLGVGDMGRERTNVPGIVQESKFAFESVLYILMPPTK